MQVCQCPRHRFIVYNIYSLYVNYKSMVLGENIFYVKKIEDHVVKVTT